jgi:hypothetical protein
MAKKKKLPLFSLAKTFVTIKWLIGYTLGCVKNAKNMFKLSFKSLAGIFLAPGMLTSRFLQCL